MLKKIAIVGPESTGKSTLSEQLAHHYHTHWVPEYARTYLNRLDRAYEEADLLQIARGQIQAEHQLIEGASQSLLFCDTDLYVIKVWSEHKYNTCDPWILQQIARRHYDLYLLTDIDLPWQYDPQREHPEPGMREYFFNVYLDIMIHAGVPWAVISGNYPTRFEAARSAIENLPE